MIRALVIALAVAVGVTAARADVARELQQANALLQRGDYQEAARIAGRVARQPELMDRADRAEAWRVYGLSLYFLGLIDEADAALLEYLKLDYDAQLDPALVPPDAIAFFAQVRVRHKQELAAYRPRPPVRRRMAFNFLPPWGQFQNGEPGKGWLIGGLELSLLATNLTTYMVLRDWCQTSDGTCIDETGEDRADAARTLRTVNQVSLVAFGAVYLYGVVDGIRGQRQLDRADLERERQLVFGVQPLDDGAFVFVGGGF